MEDQQPEEQELEEQQASKQERAQQEHAQQGAALVCGDGVWEPGEACDLQTNSTSTACSEDCQIQSIPVTEGEVIEAGYPRPERYLGNSRHPSAVSRAGFGVIFLEVPALERVEADAGSAEEAAGSNEAAEPDPVVRAEFFSRDGARRGNLLLSEGMQAVYGASPALSALSDGGFVGVFEAFDADNDELGIALRRISFESGPNVSFTAGLHVTANQQATADQYDPDVLRVGSDLIVAWTDDSNAATSPDLRFRKFSESLNPNGDEQTLADTEGIEGSVALSAFGSSWAAAWRSIPLQGANFADLDAGVSSVEEFSGAEQLVVAAPDLDLRWTVSGLSPAPADDRPALVALNDETLLVAFAVGTQPDGHDLADVSRLRVAVLHEGNVGEVTPCDPGPSSAGPGSVGVFAAPDVSLGQPTLAVLERATENEALLGWRSGVVPGNALGERALGDELWQRSITWAAAPAVLSDCTDLDFTDAVPAPAAEEEREDDQRHLGLIAERGLLIATWEDYGRTQSSAQGTPDVLVRLSPFATLCSEEDPCGNGEGHCESDEECEEGLKCGSNNGEAFGYQENINICIPCGNGIQELGEECDESIQTPTCNANCTLPFCGDGVVQDADEQCEPEVSEEDSEDCNANCTLAQCGDGYVNAAAEEECEPLESGVNDAECDANCTFAECGDGVLNPSAGELCELTNPACPLDCGVGTCPSGGCLRLESRLLSVAPNDNELHPQLRLTNLSAQTLNLEEYSLRYWFYYPFAATFDLAVLWDPAFVVEGQMAVSTLTPERVGANRYVTVPLEGTLGPSGAQLALEFRWRPQSGFPNFIESNDHSYLETLSYTENTKITVYRNGVLVWGQEPAVIPVCGNGVVEMGEACDTSGQSGDCDADCSLVVCGDGTVNSSANEECDPGDDPQCMPDCSGLMACTNPAECLHIKYHHYSDDTPTNQQIKFAFQLVNNSSVAVPLSDITIRYWFTKEPSGTFQTACDFTTVAGGCSSVVHGGNHGTVSPARGGANYVWRTGFTSDAGTLAANSSSGEVLIRGQNDPWLPFNENEDYSYINTITPTVTTTITVYLNGELVWGEEPEVTGQVCGNSSMTGTEQCDTGSQSSSCDADCTTPICGDGTVNSSAGEACDPASDPTCRPDCLGPLYCTNSASCLHVKLRTHSSDTPTNSQIRPLFQLINNGPSAVTLSDLKIRYWFTKEPSGTFQPLCDSTPTSGGCGAISSNHAAISPALSGANYYWETTFTSAAGSIAIGASSGDIRLRGQTSSGGNFSEASDYSYINTTTVTVTTKVALYYNNVLVWGQEPPPAPPVCPNNIMEGTEQCDTGGQSSTCDADCTFPTCGDGTVNSAAGEVCDTALDSQCNSTCTGFITCSSSSSCLHVTYAHNIEDTASDNTIKPRFNVVNNGSTTVSLSQIRIRYWFTKEPSAAFQTWCDFATLGCSSIVHNASSGALSPTKPTANYFWEVGFTSGSLAPGQSTGEIVVRANVVDWANFNESNDFSYANWTTPAPRSQIGLYKNGTRVWGSAP